MFLSYKIYRGRKNYNLVYIKMNIKTQEVYKRINKNDLNYKIKYKEIRYSTYVKKNDKVYLCKFNK